ncbi:MAG: T9SS type A sorting domain-containing protein, partial [Bacteroidota bacterium]
TRYTAIMEVPRDDAAAVSIRSRAWHKWTGLSYWDDFEMLEVLSVITSVDEDDLLVDGTVPLDYALHQNYPNPFNPSTTITYDVPSAGLIGLEIYNVLGQKVRTLLNEVRTAGTWQAVWNGTDDGGNLVPSGIYFYRLSSSDVSITKKMMLLK